MSPLSMQVLDCIRRNPGGYTMAELERILKRPAQEIENSVSSLRSARYIVQDGDAHWRLASKPVNGYDGVVHPGERRICAQCGIAKGAQAYIAGNTICNLCLDKPSSPATEAPKEIATALRTCARCGETKPSAAFYGGQHKCKRCCIEVNAEHRRARRAIQQPPAVSTAKDESPKVADIAAAKPTPPAVMAVIDALVAEREQLQRDYEKRRLAIDNAIEQINLLYGVQAS